MCVFFFFLARGNFSLVSCCVDQVPRRGKKGQGPFFVVRGLFTLCAIAIFVNNGNLRKIFFVVPFGRECSDLGVKGRSYVRELAPAPE